MRWVILSAILSGATFANYLVDQHADDQASASATRPALVECEDPNTSAPGCIDDPSTIFVMSGGLVAVPPR